MHVSKHDNCFITKDLKTLMSSNQYTTALYVLLLCSTQFCCSNHALSLLSSVIAYVEPSKSTEILPPNYSPFQLERERERVVLYLERPKSTPTPVTTIDPRRDPTMATTNPSTPCEFHRQITFQLKRDRELYFTVKDPNRQPLRRQRQTHGEIGRAHV